MRHSWRRYLFRDEGVCFYPPKKARRRGAYRAVNSAMVQAYWLIGKRIVEVEQAGQEKAAYAEAVLKGLSRELTSEFGKGFSCAISANFIGFIPIQRFATHCVAN